MPKSSRVRLSDMRGVFRLLNEIQERRDDPADWQRHMVFGLCGLLGARQGTALTWSGFRPDGDLQLLDFVHGGWPDPRAAELWQYVLHLKQWRGDPLLNRATHVPGIIRTRLRQQLVSDAEWYGSVGYNEVARVSEHDHAIVAWHRAGGGADQAEGLAFHRAAGEPAFSLRQRNVLHLFNVELYRMRREGKLDSTPLPLTARQKEVLRLLLAGDGEKQVAHKLDISRHTVNDHVKAIYQRLGVNSRGELMARFVK